MTTAIVVNLAAVVATTIVALSVQQFHFDVEITLWTQHLDLGPLRFLRDWLFWMGNIGVAGVLLVTVSVLLWYKGYLIEACFVVMTAIPNLLNYVLRAVIARPRPTVELVEVIGGPQGFSFPSGHALHVSFFYGFLIYLAIRLLTNKRLINTILASGIVYIPFSGLWLIYDGRHWFTDILGGYVYGSFYLLVWIAAYRWAKNTVEMRGQFTLLLKPLLHFHPRPERYPPGPS